MSDPINRRSAARAGLDPVERGLDGAGTAAPCVTDPCHGARCVDGARLAYRAGVHRTYVGRLERGESGVTVDALAAILAGMSVSLAEFFEPFDEPVRPPTPRRR